MSVAILHTFHQRNLFVINPLTFLFIENILIIHNLDLVPHAVGHLAPLHDQCIRLIHGDL